MRDCETGQFNTSYEADQRICRIVQGRWLIAAILVTGAVVVPLLATEYFSTEIMIPFLILSLAAVGLHILVGYCGQLSPGTGAFMSVGAYAAYNLWLRVPFLDNLVMVFLFCGALGFSLVILSALPSP